MKRFLDPPTTQSTMKSQMEFEEKSDFSLPSLLLENFQSKISMLDQLLYTSLWPGVFFHFSEEDFMKRLRMEYLREFLGEGQIFYLYKRLFSNINSDENGYDTNTYGAKEERYVLPLPSGEIANR